MPRNNHWTSPEIKLLRERYSRVKGNRLARELPRHTAGSIRATAYQLGLRRRGRDWMAIIRNHVPKCDFWDAGGLG